MPREWREALERARRGEIAFLDHAWKGQRILKVICANRDRLLEWGRQFGLSERHLHDARVPHFDLRGVYRERFLNWLEDDRAADS